MEGGKPGKPGKLEEAAETIFLKPNTKPNQREVASLARVILFHFTTINNSKKNFYNCHQILILCSVLHCLL